MRLLVLVVALLVASCAQKVEKEKRPPHVKRSLYYPPVMGSVQKFGRGVFIKTGCGKYVRAVEGGRVVYSGRDVGNYGWIVIIEQRDGLVSVYGKMERPWVKTGEKVRVRQVIGKVGRNRGVCGIYYELRNRKGDPVRPVVRW